MTIRVLHLFISIASICTAYSQKLDNTASLRSLGNSYFRFSYDNDFFSANDYYYTQGYSFELASPSLKKNPFNSLLISGKDTSVVYKVALEHIGFTPTSIEMDKIQVGDRPFSAALMLKSTKTQRNTLKRQAVFSTITVGAIGPIAFGGKMQKTIHRWIGDVEPKGWQHQIQNDLIINYEIGINRAFLSQKYVQVGYSGSLRAGTLNTRAQSGLNVIVGRYSDQFNSTPKRYQFYLFSEPLLNAVAHDATLQGTFFNESPYVIRSSQIQRFVLQNNFGAILKTEKWFLEYYQTLIGKEFETGKVHRWGGFKVGKVL